MTLTSSGPAHRALDVPEIFLQIISTLPRSATAAVAITCQAWKELSLDALWKEIDLVNLLNVLAPIEQRGGELFFTRPITPIDWTRFGNLSYRVRSGDLGQSLHFSALAEIHATNPSSLPLLPYITDLYVSLNWNGHLSIFMSPTLHSLRLDITDFGDAVARSRVLTSIPVSVPELRKLEIHIFLDYRNGPNVLDIAGVCGSLRNLRSVDVGVWNNLAVDIGPIVMALAALPSLETLELGSDGHMQCQWSTSAPSPFPRLRQFLFRQRNAFELPALLTIMPPNLVDVEIGRQEEESSGDMRRILVAAGRHQALETLVLLSLEHHEHGVVDISPEVLRPLYFCTALKKLSITAIDGKAEMNDDDIAALVSNLPCLEYLKLEGWDFSDEPSRSPTLQALVIITTACPVIETISLQVDATGTIPDPAFKPHSSLSFVSMHDSKIDHPESIALFFSRLSDVDDFRLHINYIPDDGRGGRDYIERWDEVVERLPSLRKARVDERSGVAQQ